MLNFFLNICVEQCTNRTKNTNFMLLTLFVLTNADLIVKFLVFYHSDLQG